MNALGTHLLVELRDCDQTYLDNLPFVRETLLSAAEDIGVTILSEAFHQFSPQGVTGIVSIAESHFSIHTWPEYGYAAVDIFTCGTTLEPYKAAQFITKRLGARDSEITEIKRGYVPVHAG